MNGETIHATPDASADAGASFVDAHGQDVGAGMDASATDIVDTRKICLLGDRRVGKTSIVDRYVRGAWPRPHFRTSTLKIDGRSIRTDDGGTRHLLLWEIARAVVPCGECSNYLQGVQGFVLVADGTRSGTVQYAIGQWQSAKTALGADIPAVMLINKSDATESWALSSRLAAKVSCYLPTFITSARSGESIDRAFACIARAAEGKGDHSHRGAPIPSSTGAIALSSPSVSAALHNPRVFGSDPWRGSPAEPMHPSDSARC